MRGDSLFILKNLDERSEVPHRTIGYAKVEQPSEKMLQESTAELNQY